jgi:hypothetical protein
MVKVSCYYYWRYYMESWLPVAIGVIGTFILTALLRTAETAIKRRVIVRSPESAAIDKIVPALNAVLEIQGPQSQAMIAMLEAQKGYCNGNVDTALDDMKAAKVKYDRFLQDSAKIKTAS